MKSLASESFVLGGNYGYKQGLAILDSKWLRF